MRAVFINHCHPATPHICAVRMREFARAVAALGHQVVLLTETLDGGMDAKPLSLVQKEIMDFDFSDPYFLACPPIGWPVLKALRGGRVPYGIRQGCVLWYYLSQGGLFADWREGARPYHRVLAEDFKPDVIWSSFGNTDCWNIAQDLARVSGCAWVADIKDHWSIFIPPGLRKILAARFSGAAAMTAFSQTHQQESTSWFAMNTKVVHSGFRLDYLEETDPGPAEDFHLSLTGSIYDQDQLASLLAGLASWLSLLSPTERRKVRFIYAGGDHARVRIATKELQSLCTVEIHDFVPLERLQAIHRSCRVNLYMKSWRTFHHKVIELLAAGRPILSFPGETEEARRIAEEAGGILFPCVSADEVGAALTRCYESPAPGPVDRHRLGKFSWEAQAVKLVEALEDSRKREQE